MTRHNAGFMVVDSLAREHGITVCSRGVPDVKHGTGTIDGYRVILAKPWAYMNNSGPPVRSLADYYGLSSDEMLVIHDDIDLALGRLKIIEKGGHGGHKGVKSLMVAFDGRRFARIRLGIGRSASGRDVVDHVLGEFKKAEEEPLAQMIEKARSAVRAVLAEGTTKAMNLFNRKENGSIQQFTLGGKNGSFIEQRSAGLYACRTHRRGFLHYSCHYR